MLLCYLYDKSLLYCATLSKTITKIIEKMKFVEKIVLLALVVIANMFLTSCKDKEIETTLGGAWQLEKLHNDDKLSDCVKKSTLNLKADQTYVMIDYKNNTNNVNECHGDVKEGKWEDAGTTLKLISKDNIETKYTYSFEEGGLKLITQNQKGEDTSTFKLYVKKKS